MLRAAFTHTLMILFLTVSLTGCDPQTRYNTLTFFFTGVPPLDAVEEQPPVLDPGPIAIPEKPIKVTPTLLFSHPVWQAGNCSPCHDSTSIFKTPGLDGKSTKVFDTGGGMPGKLILPKTKICIQCHTDKTTMRALTENLWLHNTTAKGDCLACHDPHQSKNKKTLRQPTVVLCLPCHKEGHYLTTPVHQTEEECLACHNPHMGINKNLLTKEYKEIKIQALQVPDPKKSEWDSRMPNRQPLLEPSKMGASQPFTEK